MDLGSGDGILTRTPLGQYPEARGVLVDHSLTMLAKAQEGLGDFSNLTFLESDFATEAWLKQVAKHGPFDAVVSGFAIHHQTDNRKKSCMGRSFNYLTLVALFLT